MHDVQRCTIAARDCCGDCYEPPRGPWQLQCGDRLLAQIHAAHPVYRYGVEWEQWTGWRSMPGFADAPAITTMRGWDFKLRINSRAMAALDVAFNHVFQLRSPTESYDCAMSGLESVMHKDGSYMIAEFNGRGPGPKGWPFQ